MGSMLKSPGGYGQREVTSADNARQVVLDEIADGVDGIKIANEDGYAGQTGLPKLTAGRAQGDHRHGARQRTAGLGPHHQGAYMMTLLAGRRGRHRPRAATTICPTRRSNGWWPTAPI
jgi:hypothetical protein